MSIIEDVLLNARSAVDTVGKKAGKVIDVSKLKFAAVDLKNDISHKYQVLGRIAFEEATIGGDYSDTKEELIDNIVELKAQLDTVNEMLQKSKQKIKCSSCGSYNSKGAVFCNKCGERLSSGSEDDQMSPDEVIDFTEDNFEDDDLL